MRSVDPVPGVLATSEQELFLRATLLDDRASMDRWVPMVDPESLDPSTLRLLPLLYPKLDSFHLPQRLRKKVEETYGQTRVKNHLHLQDLQRLLITFESNRIPTLLLKGNALIFQYYKDHGLRPMNDLDILIPTECAAGAIELLKTIGYEPEMEKDVQFSKRLIPFLHGYAFVAKSQSKVDLHWHVLHECLREGDDTDFWKDSIPTAVDGIQTRLLNPADQILHLCVHGYRWFVISSIRWIADVLTILHSGAVVDWDRIILQANQRRLMLPVGHSLQYLRSTFGANIPGSLLLELNEPSSREIAEFQYLAHDHRKNLLGNLPVLWYSYNRNSNKPGLKGFVRYLQQFWNVRSSVLLPWTFFRKFILRLGAKQG